MPHSVIKSLESLEYAVPSKSPHKEITGTILSGNKQGLDFVPRSEMRIAHAIEQIYADYGDTVVVKPKSLRKFGRSLQVSNTTRTTLMNLPSGTLNETYVSSNTITHISSTSADTVSIVYEGHTIDGSGNLTFVSDSVTLQGTTKTALPTPVARATRAYNDSGTALVGTVYVYEDVAAASGVPGTASAVHLMIPAGSQQSFKASTSISSQDYWIITQVGGGVEKKSSAFADINLEIRLKNKVFRERFNYDVNSSNGSYMIDLNPAIIVPPNSDIRLTALADTANTAVTGFIAGYLALIQS